jgi:hypothetical protein|tara:strand:- start:253 stop:486 length:234 start_codon:yes stop_codon:yes gene_type:complete
MSVIKTIEDGWDCVPELKEAVNIYENVGHHIYEIKNCVRSEDLEQMVGELLNMCYDMKQKLEEIDDSLEFETVDDEE